MPYELCTAWEIHQKTPAPFFSMKYFTIEELCASQTAKKQHIDNTPTPEIEEHLRVLIEHCLDPIREEYGKPIIVNSGYRCPELNKAVGGKLNSFHLKGCAADIVGNTNAETYKIYQIAKDIGVYNECLFESNRKGSKWLHISFDPKSTKRVCLNNYNG